MKKMMFLCCALAAALVGTVSCDPAEKDGYEGTNYVYLSSSVASKFDVDPQPVEVEVNLTTAIEADIELYFVSDDESDILILKDNPVVIKAGEKKGSFNIYSNTLPEETSSLSFKIGLDKSKPLPEKMQLDKEFGFVVNSASSVGDLTDEQKAIVEAYKTSSGIDLSKYIGLVTVDVTYSECDPNSSEYLDPVEYKTQTVIALSEKSTADQPVLKMIKNPMGINDRMYETFKKNTVLYSDWTSEEEGASPAYKLLMETIGWTAESQETFEVRLDDIKLLADKTIDFLKVDEENAMTIVPFEFYFSAYEREKEARAEGRLDDIEVDSDATANPYVYVNYYDIAEDGYGTEGAGLWTESSASISAAEMKFIFCFDCANGSDYTKVEATYTPNK